MFQLLKFDKIYVKKQEDIMTVIQNSEQVRKILREKMKVFCKENGYKKRKNTLFLKDYDELIQYISFDIRYQGVNCEIAIQPLYMPAQGFVLEFGNRLEHYSLTHNGNWALSPIDEEIEEEFDEMILLFKTSVGSWFEKNNSIEKIIENLETGQNIRPSGLSIEMKHEMLGFSYARLGELEKARENMQEYVEITKDRPYPEHRKYQYELYDTLVNHPEKVESLLESYKQNTREALRLDKKK